MTSEPGRWVPSGQGDILDQLAADHEELTRLFSAMLGVPIKDPERKQLLRRATELLVEHDAIEEVCLYPTVRSRVPDGAVVADAARRDHVETDVQLRRPRAVDEHTPGFDRQVALLHEHVTGHIGWEQARVYALLRETLPQQELDTLGSQARALRASVPRRPAAHPGVKPPQDPFTPPELSLRERLRQLFTPAGGWHRRPI